MRRRIKHVSSHETHGYIYIFVLFFIVLSFIDLTAPSNLIVMQQDDNIPWEKDPTCFIWRMSKPLLKNSIVMIRTLQGDSPEPGWTLAWTHDDAPFDKHTDLKITDEADFFVGVTTLQRVFAVEAEHGFRACYYRGYEEEAIRADSII